MREASIKIYHRIQNTSITANNLDMSKVILRSLLAVIGLFGLVYILLIGLLVLNIVERKDLEKQTQALSTELSELELEYLALSASINQELSKSMGFHEIPPSFATRKSLGSLVWNGNEI